MTPSRSTVLAALTLLLPLLIAPPRAAIAQDLASFPGETFPYDEAHPAAGHWMGYLHYPEPGGGPPYLCELLVGRADDEDRYTAALTCIPMGALAQPIDDFDADGRSVELTHESALGITYRLTGEVSEDGQRWTGEVEYVVEGRAGEQKGTFEYRRVPRPGDLPTMLAYTGNLREAGVQLEMTILLAETPGGHWVGALDVPSQGLRNFPLINVAVDEDENVTGVLALPGDPRIAATFDQTRARLVGAFSQGPARAQVNFALDPNYEFREMARPQHPKPPFPYQTRNFGADHPTDGIRIAGTLTIPDPNEFGGGPFPVVVLVSGSGQQDRDETIFGHKPFLVIADHLTRHGIAVARYDDRGVGGSIVMPDDIEERLINATSATFATDTRAVIEFLKSQDEIDPDRIGIIGHSEGGIIAPLVANDGHDDIAFIVLLAGPGVTGRDLIALQVAKSHIAQGGSEETSQRITQHLEKAIDLILADTEPEKTEAELRATARLLARKREDGTDESPDAMVESVFSALKMVIDNPWARWFCAHDPAEDFAKLTCPVLAMNGELDLQVWHEQNLDRIARVIKEAGGDVTVRRYENLNHLFQPAKSGHGSEYALIETTFDDEPLEDLTGWILETTRKAPH